MPGWGVITAVSIEGFRGILAGHLEGLTPLTVLTGPNSCGKSTVLDALLIAGHPRTPAAIERVVWRRPVARGARWLIFRSGEGPARVAVKSRAGDERACTLMRWAPGVHFEVKSPGYANVSTVELGADNRRVGGLASDFGGLSDVPEVRLVEPREVVSSHPLHRIYSASTEAGRRDEVTMLLRELLPGLDRVEILTDEVGAVLYLSYPDHSEPAGLAGDGVQSLLNLALELGAARTGVMLVVEPEVHQHQKALELSAKAIVAAVKRRIQVVVSTQSLELVDALLAALDEDEVDALSLFRLRLEGGELQNIRLDGQMVRLARAEKSDLR